jgi:nucleobase:cation symporter-1, NCS1 family
MATVWNGVNGVQGGQCVYAMLHAIFPGIATLPNIMGKGSALDSGGFIGYVIFWIATCCFLHIPIPKMRILVYIKLVVYLISAVSMLAWCLTLAGGPGPVVRQPSQVHGSAKAWLMVRFFFLAVGSVGTFISNASDFQRYAQKPNDVILGQIVGFPMADLTVCLVGNIVASSSVLVLGELEWNPLTYLDRIQSNNYTSANRAGVFFIAAMFAYSAVFSSVFENSIPAGNDYAALLPKYISIKTGMYLCQVISVLINPWYLLGSASVFINFLASYQVFLSAITGVLVCNYWVISRGYFKMDDLFTARKDGAYYFTKGWNIRAYIAYVLAIAPNMAGFLGSMGVSMPLGVTRAYYMAYPIGLIVSFVTFWVSNLLQRPAIMLSGWHEPKNYYRPGEDPELNHNVLEGAEVVDSRSEDGSATGATVEVVDDKRTTNVQEKTL